MEISSIKHINKKNANIKDVLFYTSLIILPLIQFFIMYICVNINSILLAFRGYDVLTDKFSWVGFNNFKVFFDSLKYQTIYPAQIKNSIIGLITTLVGIFLAMIFSYYIFKKLFLHNFFKIVLFIPSIISSIVIAVIFSKFVNDALPAYLLKYFNIQIDSLLNEQGRAVFPTILFYNLWVSFGTQLLMFVGAMNNISESTIEACHIDGASTIREFFSIVVPGIYSNISVFVTVAFAQIFVNQFQMFSLNIKNEELLTIGAGLYMKTQAAGSNYNELAPLAAIGIIATLVTLPITFVVRYLMKKFGPSIY